MKIKSLVILILSTNLSYAGFNGLTHHSRANCLNNETITWDATQYVTSYVATKHYEIDGNKFLHSLESGWVNTWRNAKVCWGEGKISKKYIVLGYHYIFDKNNNVILAEQEMVEDCSIYDGWWDRDQPNTIENKKF